MLLGKGHRVHGVLARHSSDTLWRLRHLGITDDVNLFDGDITDLSSMIRIVEQSQAREIYNLTAQSFVAGPGPSRY